MNNNYTNLNGSMRPEGADQREQTRGKQSIVKSFGVLIKKENFTILVVMIVKY